MTQKGVLLLLSTLIVLLISTDVVYADLAPLPGFASTVALGILVIAGILVVIIALVSFLAIRNIKKKRANEADSSTVSADRDAAD